MAGLNKAMIIGNVGNQPEPKTLPDGTLAVVLSLATSEKWQDKRTGEMVERTEWHRAVFYGRLAEIVRDYVGKGSKLYVEGKLQTKKWQDKQGVERFTTEINVQSLQLLDSRFAKQEQNPTASTESQGQKTPQNRANELDDEIPF